MIVENLILLIVLAFVWYLFVSRHVELRHRLVYNILGGVLIGFGMKLAGLQVFM